MTIQFVPVTLTDLLPTLQQHIGAFPSPIDSFLEDHILASTHYSIRNGIEQGRLLPAVASCGMFTVPAHRNQGIGPAIITHLIGCCLAQGLRPVAGCWYYNHRSKKTLEKAGLFSQTRLLKISY